MSLSFEQKILDIHGEAGAEWLRRLPDLLASCARRWSLALLPPFPDLSYNYVAPVRLADGSPAVLKMCLPNPELRAEIEALRLFDGQGIAKLLDADSEGGVMLLERLLPGAPLAAVRAEEALTRAAAGVMRALWKRLPPAPLVGAQRQRRSWRGVRSYRNLATVAGWAGGLAKLRRTFDGGTGPFPRRLVERAEALFPELLASMTRDTLIHGDLHPQNILSAERSPWLAIDPKGVVGCPWYDAATYMNSLTDVSDPMERKRRLDRRAGLLAELLGVERRTLLNWALAQGVLSGWWSYEDHGRGWEEAFEMAEMYEKVLRNA